MPDWDMLRVRGAGIGFAGLVLGLCISAERGRKTGKESGGGKRDAVVELRR